MKKEITCNLENHQSEAKQFCKGCLVLVCDKCKSGHMQHLKELSDVNFFYSHMRFEIEKVKMTLNSNLKSMEVLKEITERIDLNYLTHVMNTLYECLLSVDKAEKSGKSFKCISDLIFNTKCKINEENLVNVKENKEVLKYYHGLKAFLKEFAKFENFENNYFDSYDDFNNTYSQLQEVMHTVLTEQKSPQRCNTTRDLPSIKLPTNSMNTTLFDENNLTERIFKLELENRKLFENNEKLDKEMNNIKNSTLSSFGDYDFKNDYEYKKSNSATNSNSKAGVTTNTLIDASKFGIGAISPSSNTNRNESNANTNTKINNMNKNISNINLNNPNFKSFHSTTNINTINIDGNINNLNNLGLINNSNNLNNISNENEIEQLVNKHSSKIIEESQKIFQDSLINQTQFDLFDKLDIHKYLKQDFKTTLNTLKIKELNILELDNDNFESIFKKNYDNLEVKGIIENIQEEINQKIYTYIVNIVMKSRSKIENEFINSFYKMYSEKSSKFKNLKTIDLKGLQLVDNDICKLTLIINNSKVNEVFLQNNYLTDKGSAYIFNCLQKENKLKNIYLDNNALNDGSLKYLKEVFKKSGSKSVNLKVISMTNNAFDNGKELLKEIKKLTKILIYI